jgi:hypothetical protein
MNEYFRMKLSKEKSVRGVTRFDRLLCTYSVRYIQYTENVGKKNLCAKTSLILEYEVLSWLRLLKASSVNIV